MKKIIYFGMIFFLMFASSVNACMVPVIKSEEGTNINPLSYCPTCKVDIWTSRYSGSMVAYNFTIDNRNKERIFVSVNPEIGLASYVSSGSLFVPPYSKLNLTLNIAISDMSRGGILQVSGYCEGRYYDQSFPSDPSIKLDIKGKNLYPPTFGCSVPSKSVCSNGLSRFNYRCVNDTLAYDTACTQTCCKSFGGKYAFCSADRSKCLIPPVDASQLTEGNIAYLCKDKLCKDRQENQLIFILQTKGWNVTPKYYKEWTEEELDAQDVIVCSDEGGACKIAFNSPIYNAYVLRKKPFLEIPFRSLAQAAYSFGYISRSNGYVLKDGVNIVNDSYITSGYSGSIDTISGDAKYAGISTKYFSSAVKDLANSGISDKSIIFKVDPDVDHGKYAFLGFLIKSDAESLSVDGEALLNRTLKWLKAKDFSLPNPVGKIAFLCSKDECKGKTEKSVIMFLRKNNYNVSAKALTSWTSDELNQFNLMMCSDGVKGCRVDMNSEVNQTHLKNQKGFLEIPDGSLVNAGFKFGYTNTSRGSTKSITDIYKILNHPILDGFTNNITVLAKKKSIYSMITSKINSVSVLALDSPQSSKNYSPMFVSDASGNKGRYAYIGWYAYPDYSTDTGRQLVLRTVRWVQCGNPNGC